MCAAFVAQQQGIALSTALKKVPDRVGDLWLMVAEFAREAAAKAASVDYLSEQTRQLKGFVM